MSSETTVERAAVERHAGLRRVLGRIRARRPGPTLVCVGGLHGNEPAGVRALHRVVDVLVESRMELRGEFVALAGNLPALTRGRRFLDRDLNRLWLEDRIASLRSGEPPASECREDGEQKALLEVLDEAFDRARGAVHVLDLHTTSGEGPPFATVGDTLRNRAFGLHFPVPLILGLEEQLEGTLVDHLTEEGRVTVGFEGGQHDDPAAVDCCEAGIWVALSASGVLVGNPDRMVDRARAHLEKATRRFPRVVEVRHRHGVDPDDDFRMRDGYGSFQRVHEGEAVAEDRDGSIRSPEDGRLLMPLYQALGDDGFFLVRKIRPVWLSISRFLRRVGADRLIHWLPGVRKDPDDSRGLRVDRSVARWWPLEIFHLLGYRREAAVGTELRVRKRRENSG